MGVLRSFSGRIRMWVSLSRSDRGASSWVAQAILLGVPRWFHLWFAKCFGCDIWEVSSLRSAGRRTYTHTHTPSETSDGAASRLDPKPIDRGAPIRLDMREMRENAPTNFKGTYIVYRELEQFDVKYFSRKEGRATSTLTVALDDCGQKSIQKLRPINFEMTGVARLRQ